MHKTVFMYNPAQSYVENSASCYPLLFLFSQLIITKVKPVSLVQLPVTSKCGHKCNYSK